MYSRIDCHLCADALEVVQRVCADLGKAFTEVDIDRDPDLRAKYSDYVPVVLVDGVQQGFWRIDEDRLRRVLNAANQN